MHASTLTLPTVALALVAILHPLDPLTFAPAESSSLAKTFESESRLASTAFRLVVDGTEIPADQLGEVKISILETGVLHVTDEYVKVGKGRPLKLKRTFDKLEGHSSQTVSGQGGEEDGEGADKRDKTSKLEGKTVVFTWNDEKEEYAQAFDEGKGDLDLISELHEDLDLRAFLPAEKVAEGASWDLDAKAFGLLLRPGGNLHLESSSDEEEDKTGEIDKEMVENLTGKAQATYKGTREVDGKKLGVITLKAELKTHGDKESEKQGKMSVEDELEVEGEVLWDPRSGHAVGLSLGGSQKAVVKIVNDESEDGESHTVGQEVDFEGTTKIEAHFRAP